MLGDRFYLGQWQGLKKVLITIFKEHHLKIKHFLNGFAVENCAKLYLYNYSIQWTAQIATSCDGVIATLLFWAHNWILQAQTATSSSSNYR